jgi:phospholipase/carboxylesterase
LTLGLAFAGCATARPAAFASGLDTTTADGESPTRRAREVDVGGVLAIEVILGEASFDEPLPTVWAFHGIGDVPRLPGGPFSGMAQPYRVVVPRGPLRWGAGYAWFPHRVAEGRHAELAAAIRAQVAVLARAFSLHAAQVPYVGRPIVTGFSQGAVMSFGLALLAPESIGAALPDAGWLPPPLWPLAPVPVDRFPPMRSTHGTADAVIPFAPTRAMVERLRALGLDVSLAPAEGVGHELSPEMAARFHGWLAEALARAREEGRWPAEARASSAPAVRVQGRAPGSGPPRWRQSASGGTSRARARPSAALRVPSRPAT